MKNRKNEYQNRRGWVAPGVAAAFVLVFLASAVGVTQGAQAYATEDAAEERADKDVAADGSELVNMDELAVVLTDEEAERAANELVTTIERLEATPEYQRVIALIEADNIDGTSLSRSVPYLLHWHNVYSGVKFVNNRLRAWQTIEGSGITAELTVDNVAKAMKKAGNVLLSGPSSIGLEYFWDGLSILQVNTTRGKLARINDQLYSKDWMVLVESVYLAEQEPEQYYSWDSLRRRVLNYVGPRAYDMTHDELIAAAKDLSDWGQAKTLFDTLGTACGYLSEDGEYSVGRYVCNVTTATDKEIADEDYERAVNAATILYPDVMKDIWDYELVLAELPELAELPGAPETGMLGTADGELTDLATAVVVAGGGVALAVGALTVVRLWTRRKF